MTETGLFSDLLVLDVGSWIAGPVATTILADYGAKVIKIELPGVGDQYRTISALPGFPDAEVNYMWQMDARNKQGLALNLKTDQGMAILHDLIRKADIYVTNHPLPMRRALGLEYDDIKAIKSDIIYASLTAYGEEGPDKDREGFDLVAYWARSGLMDLVRDADASPAMAIPGMGDHPSAVSLYASITTALIKRMKTGEGSMVHTSLLANGLWSASCIAQAGFAGGNYTRYRQFKSERQFMSSLYQSADGLWLQITMVRDDEELQRFFALLGYPSLMQDERFNTIEARTTNSAALYDIIKPALANKTADVWLGLFAEAKLNVIPLTRIEEVPADPMIEANGMTKLLPDGGRVIRHPVNVEGLPEFAATAAPEIGEHSEQILRDLGYVQSDIEALKQQGVI